MTQLAAWNLARGLSSEEKHVQVEEGIQSVQMDILVLSESIDNTGLIKDPNYAKQLGFSSYTVPYDDLEHHPSGEQYITLLSRIALHDVQPVWLGSRNVIKANITDPVTGQETNIFGAHFDDRSEAARKVMANALLESIKPDDRVVLAGDLNSMPTNDRVARILRSPAIRKAAALSPHPRVKSLATRLTDMATGDVMRLLEHRGFIDADSEHRPTMSIGPIGFALDHLMHTSNVVVNNFKVHKLPGSDHKAISATIH